jgi:hypothetical protein
VVTITAPVTGTFCDSVSWMSPVPGGMSTIRKSTSRQLVSLSSCSSACVTIGPRHTIGVSTSIRKPIDIACTP